MIITCPNCETRYQVGVEAIGSAGRKVQCANCHKAWQALPETPPAPHSELAPLRETDEDRLRADTEEDRLDHQFETAADGEVRTRQAILATLGVGRKSPARPRVARPTGSTGPRGVERLRKAFDSLPHARVRLMARISAAVLLVTVVAGVVGLRVELVRSFPALAGLYGGLGLPVNVAGLDFSNVTSLRTWRDGQEVMVVRARIASVAGTAVTVPEVEVRLYGAAQTPLYEWSVAPRAQTLGAGETIEFETQLTSPPPGAERIRLSFATSARRWQAVDQGLEGI